jgi:hypothetical protein
MPDLTGTWRSVYEYPSSSRGGTFSSEHDVTVAQDGITVRVRSYGSSSRVMIDLEAAEVEDGVVLTGTWREHTDPVGYYEGTTYRGAVQFVLSEDGNKMSGAWVGHDRALTETNTGSWELERIPGGS